MSFHDTKFPTLSKALTNSHNTYKEQAAVVLSMRNQFLANEAALNGPMMELANSMGLPIANVAAELPGDAFRDIDEVTKRVARHDEGQAFMMDLMPLARTVDIGKTVHLYRTSNDVGIVKRSMSGQVADEMDKVSYDFRGHPVPIFTTAYGRNWREWLGQRSENFDAIMDDQEAHSKELMQDMARYVLNGDTNIVVQGYNAYGIFNHPMTNLMDLDASGFNIDLASYSTTADDIENFFMRDFGQVMDDNFIMMPMNLYVSPEIMRRFDRSYTGAGGFKNGSLGDFLTGRFRINKIVRTYELTGNQFFAFVPSSEYIRPLVGMAMSSIAMPRHMITDDYNFRLLSAMGLEIRADANNRSGVIYGAEMA